MNVPKYIQDLVDSGDASIGVSNLAKSASFIGHPFEVERKGVASNKQEAAALGYPVFIDEKGARVQLRAEPMAGTDGLSAVVKGKNKRNRFGVYKKSNYKKAFVSISKDSEIQFEGIY